jgi:hypothetical protein
MSRVTAARRIFEDATEARIHTYNWRKYRGIADLTDEQLDDALRLDREWLQRQINSGSQIFDIGTPTPMLGDFYSEELRIVGDQLTPILRGRIDIGGELADLWEWVRPVVAP